MKVGILTLPLWHNYGGILQAYALRQAIESLGHKAIFLDVHRKYPGKFELVTSRLKRSLRWMVRGSRAIWYPDQHELAEISRNTRNFVHERINPKTAPITVDSVIDFARDYDALVVGSDQVWRREYMPSLQIYTLAFGGSELCRVSYAASLGVEDWRFSLAESRLFSESLRKFRSISVREESAINLLQRELGADAVRVCDPTLLFNADHYCQLAGVSPRSAGKIKRIFTYILDAGSANAHQLASLVNSFSAEAFSIMPKAFGPGFRFGRESHVYPKVEAWLQAFNDADMVITDSFHGCVFSLIFNRPFIAIANIERGRSRFESLLGRFGLRGRLFPSTADVDASRLEPINWEVVNSIRAEERAKGLDFLRIALTQERTA